MSERSIGVIVTSELDLANPKPFTAEELQQLERLRQMSDEEIDFSDSPNQAGKGAWHRPGLYGGAAGALRRAALAEKMFLVEPDALEFFKASGEGAPNG